MKKSKKATFFMICFVMVALAFIDGILGVFLPQIKPELGINDTQASAVFVVNLLGFCVFTSIGGHLCDKIGSRKSFFLLLGILLLFCLAMLCAHTYARLILLSFILYCALAALTVTVNSFIPSLFTTSQAFFMSFFHLVNYGGIALSKNRSRLADPAQRQLALYLSHHRRYSHYLSGTLAFQLFPSASRSRHGEKAGAHASAEAHLQHCFFSLCSGCRRIPFQRYRHAQLVCQLRGRLISHGYCQGLLCLFSVFYFFCSGKRTPRPVHQTSWRIRDCSFFCRSQPFSYFCSAFSGGKPAYTSLLSAGSFFL